MSKDFKVTSSKATSQAFSAPSSTNVYTPMGQVLNALGDFSSKLTEQLNVEKAVQEGAKARLEGKTVEKLAPGVNKVTASFNQAYRTMDLNLNYAEYGNEMDEAFQKATAPGRLNHLSFNEYKNYSQEVISDSLRTTEAANRPELAFRLKLKAMNNELSFQSKLSDKEFKDGVAAGKASMSKLAKDYENAVLAGNEDLSLDLRNRFINEVDSQQKLGYMDEFQAFVAKEGLESKRIESMYSSFGQQDALIPGLAEENLFKLVNSSAQELDLTESQYQQALSSYATAASNVLKMKAPQQAMNYAWAKNEILKTDENGQRSGLIQTQDDLDNAAIYGDRQMTPAQYYQASALLRKTNMANLKSNAAASSFWNKVQAGNGIQNTITEKEADAGWADALVNYRDQRRTETANPNYELNATDEANLAIMADTPIKSITSRLDYALNNASIEKQSDVVQWALSFGQKVGNPEDGSPNVLRNLSSKSRAILNMANEAMSQFANPDMQTIVEGARQAANVDSPTQEARIKQMTSRSRNRLIKDFEGVFGGKADPEGPEFGAFMNALSIYIPISDSYDNAIKSVKQQLWPTFGVDDRFGEKGKVQYLPPNKTVPFSDTSAFYRNQVGMKLEAILERNNKSEDVDPLDKVKFVGKKNLNRDHSEYDVFSKDLYGPSGDADIEVATGLGQEKWIGEWRGQKVDIYTEADQFSRIQDNEKIRRRFYFRNPVTNEKMYIKDPGNNPGSLKKTDGSGFAVMYDDQLSEMLPTVYKDITQQDIKSAIDSTLVAEFKNQPGNIGLGRYSKFRKYIKQRGPELEKIFESKMQTSEPVQETRKPRSAAKSQIKLGDIAETSKPVPAEIPTTVEDLMEELGE